MPFDQPTRNRLAKFVGEARALLTEEFTRQLQHEYGLDHLSGEVTPLENLTALDDARRETARILRETLEYYLAALTPSPSLARVREEQTRPALERIVREQAFTVLNRLCALRMAEGRGYLIESVGRGYQSTGFQLYARLAGSALGETGEAYRSYLFSIFDEFALDLPALFDRFSPQGRLFPREGALLRLLELINNLEIAPLWAEDETIGWIYQYFNTIEERQEMRKTRAPQDSRALAVRNQFFTPRYVVEFLTDNTLGRIWYEMTQGVTSLKQTCRYLVRRPEEVFLAEAATAGAEHAWDWSLEAADWLLKGDEDSFPPFDADERSRQRLIQLASMVDGYRRYPQPVEREPWELARLHQAIHTQEDLSANSLQELLDVMFFMVRSDDWAGGEFLDDPRELRLMARLGNEVRRRVLAGRGEDLSQEELLRAPVFIPYCPLKDPREIRMLDPACGSMHFGLYAFDLFERIYEEAWDLEESLGQDAFWRMADLAPLHQTYPDKAAFLQDVPRLILAHNIHGIDIDPRAVQIAGLSLWLRAQKSWQAQGLKPHQRPQIRKSNVVCAEPMPGDLQMLEEFCQGLQPPLIGQLVKAIFEKMKMAGEAGSLLKIEQELEEAIHAAKIQMDAQSQAEQLAFWPAAPKPKQLVFDLGGIAKSDAKFWQTVENRVLKALQEYAVRTVNGQEYRRRLFADDAAQGFAFIDLCRRRYDVILMNPPFGEPSTPSKNYVEEKYKRTKGDVLANFVERTLELSKPRGKIGAITNRTPFFLTSQVAFRQQVLQKEGFIEVMADLGAGVLEAMVETAAYTFSPAQPPNRESSFIRCLMVSDKQDLILQSVAKLSQGQPTGNIFFINPDEFARIEGAPYCYWIGTRTIRQVSKYPKLEGNYGTVRVGLQTGDDWRFLRNVWEIPADLIGPAPRQSWDQKDIRDLCLRDFESQKQWAFYSKTDSALPWFSPLTLVVKWSEDGDEIKNFTDEKGKLRSRPQNLEFYFRPGFSYMLRSTRIVPYIVPSSVIPTAGRAQVYPEINKEYALIGYCASQVASAIARFNGENFGQPKFQASMIQNLPTPEIAPILLNHIKELIESEFKQRKLSATQYEPYQEFAIPAIFGNNGFNSTEWSRFSLLGPDLELAIAQSMGLDADQLDELARDIRESLEMQYSSNQTNDEDIDEESGEDELATVQFIEDSEKTRNEELISYLVGLYLGRWDARFALHPELIPDLPGAFDPLPVCPFASLVNVDGLPAFKGQIVSEAWLRARPDAITLPEMVGNQVVGKDGQLHPATIPDEEYPIRVAWDGILVDDPDHPDDIVTRSHEVLELLFPGRGEEVEQKACQILGVRSLREYFRKPGLFFADHLKRYSKSRRVAPIYWPLSTPSGSYTLWLYYHRLNDQTLYTCVNDFVDPKLKQVSEEAARLRLKKGRSAADEKELERLTDFERELKDFREELLRVAKFWKPNLNDGVEITAALLWKLFQHKPWQKRLRETWGKLESGEYDWAHLAYAIWPERVREKCKTDKSLAIAHDLEELYMEPPQKPRKRKGEQYQNKTESIINNNDFEE